MRERAGERGEGEGEGGCAGRKGAKAGSDRFERTTETRTWLRGLKMELFLPGPLVFVQV